MKNLAMHIMDIAQNSVSAGSTIIKLTIEESIKANQYRIIIKDNGRGMDSEMTEKVIDPFVTSRTTRKVGLGLPLLKQNAERTGGNFKINSELGKGTLVNALFIHNNLDRPPAGDIAGVVVLLATANPEIELIFTHTTDEGKYIFDTREVKEALEGVPINDNSIYSFIKEMVTENLKEIKISE